jgi:hypothetical protein
LTSYSNTSTWRGLHVHDVRVVDGIPRDERLRVVSKILHNRGSHEDDKEFALQQES